VFDNNVNIVFNANTMNKTDKEILDSYGGSTAVAKLLGYDLDKGGAQKVNNWYKRGIPAQVKVDHPELFLFTDGKDGRKSPGRRATDKKLGRRSVEVPTKENK
jgi:hypothetical protein